MITAKRSHGAGAMVTPKGSQGYWLFAVWAEPCLGLYDGWAIRTAAAAMAAVSVRNM